MINRKRISQIPSDSVELNNLNFLTLNLKRLLLCPHDRLAYLDLENNLVPYGEDVLGRVIYSTNNFFIDNFGINFEGIAQRRGKNEGLTIFENKILYFGQNKIYYYNIINNSWWNFMDIDERFCPNDSDLIICSPDPLVFHGCVF